MEDSGGSRFQCVHFPSPWAVSQSLPKKKVVLHIAEAGHIAGFHLEFQIKVLQLFPHALEVVS